MYLSSIGLKNFRNYSDLKIDFNKNINFIVGTNGSGKTNILEAVTVLSGIKSFRNASDNDLIRWGNDSFFVSTNCIKSISKDSFKIGYVKSNESTNKKIKINENEINRFSDYYGIIVTVIFAPEDINFVNNGPSVRRKYFDSLISKVDKKYLQTLTDLKKILTSRNICLKSYLESKSNKDEILVWNKLFSEKAEYIVNKRKEFLDEFSQVFKKCYENISLEKQFNTPVFEYKTNCNLNKNDILFQLDEKFNYDLIRKTTTIGPQRDDFVLFSEEKLFSAISSQGQKRTSVIALKMAEIEIIERNIEDSVIILIDDIFSELDIFRKKNLIDTISKKNQIIITVVSIDDIKEYFKDCDVKIFSVDEGHVEIQNEMEF